MPREVRPMKETEKSGGCVVLIAEHTPGKGEAVRLVRRELLRRGERPWKSMEIEIYPGAAETLIIARQSREESVYIDSRAVCFLLEKFGV